ANTETSAKELRADPQRQAGGDQVEAGRVDADRGPDEADQGHHQQDQAKREREVHQAAFGPRSAKLPPPILAMMAAMTARPAPASRDRTMGFQSVTPAGSIDVSAVAR